MITQPHNVPVSERDYELAEDYAYEWMHKGEVYRIFIPKGLIYDGASVPRIVWTISGLTPDGLLRAGALVHDFIYMHKGVLPPGSWQRETHVGFEKVWIDMYTKWNRKQADAMLQRILEESGVSAYRRTLAYSAVRMFGGKYWRD